jgi:hypothetical protein
MLFCLVAEQRQEQPGGATHLVKYVAAKQQLPLLALFFPSVLNHPSCFCRQVSKLVVLPHVV